MFQTIVQKIKLLLPKYKLMNIAKMCEEAGFLHTSYRLLLVANRKYSQSAEIMYRLSELISELASWPGYRESYLKNHKLQKMARRIIKRSLLYKKNEEPPAPDFQKAVSLLEKATCLNNNPKMRFLLATIEELLGNYDKAINHYNIAIRQLKFINKRWAHKAKIGWTFRLKYITSRLQENSRPEGLLSCTLSEGDKITYSENFPGFFNVNLAESGLIIKGIFFDKKIKKINIYIDNHLIRTHMINNNQSLGRLKFKLRPEVIQSFPVTSNLKIMIDNRLIPTANLSSHYIINVPYGDNTIAEKLENGLLVTKKGTFSKFFNSDIEKQRQYFNAYAIARELFKKKFNIDLFILYGTLLGQHRNGTFIKGDDDFDVGYVINSRTPSSVKLESSKMVLKLLQCGLDVGVTIIGRLYKLKINGVLLDVFPLWFSHNKTWGFQAISASKNHFIPVKHSTFFGHEVLIPNDPEKFLSENYGPGWKIPDSSFKYYKDSKDKLYLQKSYLTTYELKKLMRLAEKNKRYNHKYGKILLLVKPEEPDYVLKREPVDEIGINLPPIPA